MTLPCRRVVDPQDSQAADQMMPSILFPPLLSLDLNLSDKAGGEASTSRLSKRGNNNMSRVQGAQDPLPFQTDEGHDCYPHCPSSETARCPSSESRRRSRRPIKEEVSRLRHSQSMPSFEDIILKMSEPMPSPKIDIISRVRNTNVDAPTTAAVVEVEGSQHDNVPFPSYIPKLRIRRTSSDMDLQIMPSPLARRGGKEIKYLQRQLKAEALQRRKQQLHNEERKKRRGRLHDDDVVSSEDEDKFTNVLDYSKFRRDGPNYNNNIMDIAGSPPAILKRYSLRRTVSEALEDSGIPEDANLLFTPMGEPLIDDEAVAHDGDNNVSSPETEEGFEVDGNSSLLARSLVQPRTSSTGNSVVTEEGSWGGSDGYDEDDVELSPSLLQSEVHNYVGDSFNQDRSDLPMNVHKKITLRPKMKVRKDSFDGPPPFEAHNIHMCESTEIKVSTDVSTLMDDMVERIDLSSSGRSRYSSPQKSRIRRLAAQRFMMTSSESFDALNNDDAAALTSDALYNRNRLNTTDSDPFDRLGTSPSFSESNYATPDNSFSNRVSVRAKLLSMNQGLELPLKESPLLSEQNFHTPSSSQPRRLRERMGMPNQVPGPPLFDATIEEEVAGAFPTETPPVQNFATPQNMLERNVNSNNFLSFPQIAELVVPQLDAPAVAANTTEDGKEEVDEKEPRAYTTSSQ